MSNAASAVVLMLTGLCVIAKAATFEHVVSVDLSFVLGAAGLLLFVGAAGFLRSSLRR